MVVRFYANSARCWRSSQVKAKKKKKKKKKEREGIQTRQPRLTPLMTPQHSYGSATTRVKSKHASARDDDALMKRNIQP